LSVVVSAWAPLSVRCSQKAWGFQKVTVVPGCLQRTPKVQTDPGDHLWMVQSQQVFWGSVVLGIYVLCFIMFNLAGPQVGTGFSTVVRLFTDIA